MRAQSLLATVRAHGLALAAWLWALVFLLATRTQPLRTNWGDALSDSNVMTSGRYFARYGFLRLGFTPVIDVGPLDAGSLKYTHYPPLPDLVNGVQQSLLGEADIATFRILADVLTLVGLVFFYRWVRALWGGVTANVALVLVTTNFLWLQYADTIHHVPLYTCAGFAALHFAARWLEAPGRKLLAFVLVGTFLCDMASYDYFFFVPVAVAITVWMKGRRLRDRDVRPLLVAVVAGVALFVVTKFGLIALATGPKNLVDDLVFQLHERVTGKHSLTYRAALAPTLFHRAVRFFTPVCFVIAASQVVGLVGWLARRRSGDAESPASGPPVSPALLLLAGAPFVVLFSQLFAEQYHPTLQFLPYYAVSAGAFVAWLWEKRSRLARPLAVAAIVVSVGWEARELARFDKTFLEREDVAAVRTYLAEHDHRRVVFTNSFVGSPIIYYFERYVLGIGQSTSADVEAFLTRWFFEHGDEPVHYIQFEDAALSVFDKHLYAMFVLERRWDWIADPVPHKQEILDALRKRGEGATRAYSAFGRLVLDTGRVKVYELDRAALDRLQAARMAPGETTLIDFGTDASNQHKVMGLQYNEVTAPGVGHCWSTSRQVKGYRFSMVGLREENAGPPTSTGVLLLRSPPEHRTLRMAVYGGLPGQEIDVRWNGKALGRRSLPGDWTEVTFDVPKEAFDASGIQKLEVQATKLNEFGLGVAMRWVRILPAEVSP